MFGITAISLLALAAGSSVATNVTCNYTQVMEYAGSSFFEGFTTFADSDPTHGFVEYVDFPTAISNNLTAFTFYEQSNNSNARVGVDYKQLDAMAGRRSVRLLSNATFDVGTLFVVDVVHAPTGPGVWPAVWLLGNVPGVEWPNVGEIDLMEWVNTGNANAVTLHTGAGQCTVESNPTAYQGTLSTTDCNMNEGKNGCSVLAPNNATFSNKTIATAGQAFNEQGGGVYVLEWATTGISAWLFPRGYVPADLRKGTPSPSTWSAKPLANFSGSGCNFSTSFQKQQLIINIDLCGDWAGAPNVWAPLTNRTGVATCNDYVSTRPASFEDAYFEFASIKVFSSNGTQPGIAGQQKVKRGYSWIGGERGSTHQRHKHGHDSGNGAGHYHHPNQRTAGQSGQKQFPYPLPSTSNATSVEIASCLAAFVALTVAAVLV